MKIEALKNNRIGDFVDYCMKHRMELDDSYLYDEDLRDFEPNDENPTYIVTNQVGVLVGAVSLMIDDYSKRGKEASLSDIPFGTRESDRYSNDYNASSFECIQRAR